MSHTHPECTKMACPVNILVPRRTRSVAAPRTHSARECINGYVYPDMAVCDVSFGKDVIATRDIPAWTNLCVYPGVRMSHEEGKLFELEHLDKEDNYLFFTKDECFDATHTDGIGRYFNHRSINPSVQAFAERLNGKAYIVFRTMSEIVPKGATLRYDYGERRPDVLASRPFLNE
jgi:hypothetical protein